jgi:hypothetical protein
MGLGNNPAFKIERLIPAFAKAKKNNFLVTKGISERQATAYGRLWECRGDGIF